MANKKLVDLDNLDKLSKSLDARYKEKIQEESERAMSQEQILGTEINVTKDMLGGKSIRYITQAEYNNLSESEKNSTTVAYFITDADDLSHGHENKDFLDNLSARSIAIGNKVQTFDGAHDLSYSISDIGAAPASHTHDDRYYTETEANNKFAPKSHSHDNYATTSDLSTEVGKLNTAISKKSDSGHKHDDYLTKLEAEESFEGVDTSISNINTQITGLQTSLAGKSDKTHNHNDDYAPKSHNHDDIYYTDDEVDNLLAGKSDSGHNHNDKYYTESEIDKKITGLQAEIDADVKTEKERAMGVEDALQAAIDSKAPSSHTHDDRYYTESEMNTKLAAKADTNHGTHVPTPQTANNAKFLRNDNSWQTVTPANIGAAPSSHNHNDSYYTKTEINTEIDNINETINTKEAALQASINGKAPSSHNHDDRYYTETEMDGKLKTITDSISSNVSTLNSAIATAKSSAISESKSYTNTAIANLVDSAPEAMNTLNELAEAISNHKDDYEAYVSTVSSSIATAKAEAIAEAAKKDTALHTTISAEIDADVKVEKERAEAAENALQAAINGKAPSSHTHDDRYYTESEINTKLAGKADSSHGNHVPATQTASNKTFLRNDNTWATVTPANIGAAPSSHTHDDRYFTETEMNGKIEDINETINTNVATLQASINGKAPSSHGNHVAYGTCSTAAATAEKAVSVSDSNWKLTTGCIVAIKFTTSNTAGNVKLNVNSSGAYPIWYNNAEYTGTGNAYTGYANRTITYMFNGTHWVWITGGYDANNTYTNASLGQGYVTCDTAESTVAKVGTLSSYGLITGGVVSVKFTYNVPASATLNINSKGAKAIYFRGAAITAGIIKAGDIATFIYNDSQYQLIAIDRWQNDIANHNHDGRYYTEAEINTKISDINNTISSEVATLTAEVNKKLNISDHGTHLALGTTSSTAFRGDYGNTAYNHSQAAHAPSNAQKNSDITKAEIEAKLTGSITSHNHDGSYYTKTNIDTKIANINDTINTKETTLQAAIDGKAPSNHTHNQINSRGNVTAETENNRPAVNGLSMSCVYNNGYPTPYGNVMTMKGGGDGQLLIGWSGTNGAHAPAYIRSKRDTSTANWSDWAQIYTTANKPTVSDIGAAPSSHTHDDRYFTETEANNAFAPKSHNHDDRYYTETEINGKIEDINETIAEKEAALQASINGKAPSSHGSHVAYGTCATAAATAAKAVSVSDTSWKLTTGCMVAVKFSASNTAGNVTLNVNSTGAYPIWYNNAAYTGNSNKYTGYANRVLTYMFNGTHWVWISGGYDDNSTYTNASLGQGYATCDTAAATVAKVGTLSNYNLTAGGVVSVKFTYAVPASATLNINSKGAKAIYFRGVAITANIIKAGDIATFMYDGSQYQLISIDRWQNDITSHNHDGRYYTETEINTKISDINNIIDSKEAALQASIDQVEGMLGGRSIKYVTQAQYNNLSAAEKESNTVTYFITDLSEEHDHNDLYYTETEVDAKIEAVYATLERAEGIKTVTASKNTLTLTTDKRQYCANVPSGTTIAFPSVSKFTEVHLYFSTSGTMNLNFPDTVKWRVDPNIDAGSSYELVATYVNAVMGWMVNIMSFTS